MNFDNGRRDIPENSNAIACVGFSWEKIMELLSNPLGEAAPEIKHKSTTWIVRARKNGIRIEFYDDDDKVKDRLFLDNVQDGPQIHAGRLHWM